MFSDFTLRHVAYIIKNGGIIAYPTDTIYGLGCDPYNANSVEQLNLIKQRPANKQFILLAGSIEQIKPLTNLSKDNESIITNCDQPTSWIVDAKQNTPQWLVSKENTVTFRISSHSNIKKICHHLGHAIISTSANISGSAPAQNSLQLHRMFHHSLDKILASNQKLNTKPSRIVRLCDNKVIRQ